MSQFIYGYLVTVAAVISTAATSVFASADPCYNPVRYPYHVFAQQWNPQVTTERFTVHGLWPSSDDRLDHHRSEHRRYRNHNSRVDHHNGAPDLGMMLSQFSDLAGQLEKYWPSNRGAGITFWIHEWNVHGGDCELFAASCYPDSTPTHHRMHDYFAKTVQLSQHYDVKARLASHGIVPATGRTYDLADLQRAIPDAQFICRRHDDETVLAEVLLTLQVQNRYHFHLLPPLQSHQRQSCPRTGIHYPLTMH